MSRSIRLLSILALVVPAIASAQVDYHRADLIRTAPAQLLGVPDDWGSGFGAAIGLARPNWLADSTRFWYRVRTVRGPEFVVVDIVDAIVARGFDRATVERVARLIDRAEYKRRQAAPGVKITPKAFGRDRRLPITNRYGVT